MRIGKGAQKRVHEAQNMTVECLNLTAIYYEPFESLFVQKINNRCGNYKHLNTDQFCSVHSDSYYVKRRLRRAVFREKNRPDYLDHVEDFRDLSPNMRRSQYIGPKTRKTTKIDNLGPFFDSILTVSRADRVSEQSSRTCVIM